jgi:4a-hydroxytetrahydrobiopterin dehydratase
LGFSPSKVGLMIVKGITSIGDMMYNALTNPFKLALDFVNKVGKIAEKEGHHPDIFLFGWNKVRISLSTHTINGLSINDFVLASKIDLLNN